MKLMSFGWRIVAFCLLGVVVILSCVMMWLYNSLHKEARVAIEAHDSMVLYSDGTAEIVYRDGYAGDTTTYRADIAPLSVDEQLKNWGYGEVRQTLPRLTGQGGNGERVIFTYTERSLMNDCNTGIFYADRITKKAHTAHSDMCIVKSLDEHDHTMFLAMEYAVDAPFEYRIGIGRYTDGVLTASTTFKVPMTRLANGSSWDNSVYINNAVTDWEGRHIVFPVFNPQPVEADAPGMLPEDIPAYLYLFDTTTNTVTNITPDGLRLSDIYQSGSSMLAYRRMYGEETGDFVLYDFNNPEAKPRIVNITQR